MSDKRAGQIATAILEQKWQKSGFNLESHDLQEWLGAKARRTEVRIDVLQVYVTQVIVPIALRSLGNMSVNMAPKHSGLPLDIVGSISLALLYTEFSLDVGRAKEKVDGLIRDGIQATKEELIALLTQYIIPAYIRKLTDADSVSITWSKKG